MDFRIHGATIKIILLQFNKYQKLYVRFELLMMGGGTAWNM
jgi:hypothetical protein